jgi:hypothetical protein
MDKMSIQNRATSMDPMIAVLSERHHAALNRIRSRIEAVDLRFLNHDGRVALLPAADLSLEALETWLLDSEQKQLLRLNPWDVFFLYASCLLCDIGLAQMVPLSPDTQTTSADASPGASAGASPGATLGTSLYATSRHCILEDWMDLGIGDASVAAVIADICGDMDPGNMGRADFYTRDDRFDGVAINRPLLSAAVGLAKSLDLRAPATAAAVCRHLSDADDITWKQYQGAFSVTGAGPHPYLSGTLQIKIQCRDPDIHRALKQHERGIQRRLQQINRHASPRFIYSDVLFEIEAQGYTPVDLKFSVDTSAALKLLTGNRLYSDNRVFLRELLQNAVDACNLRKRLEASYEPSIHIRFNKDISTVTVRDNGIGMDRQWIEKYFLTIGISLYQSSEVRRARERSHIDFSFISQFGIGFLSSFLVAEKIIIKTRKTDGRGMRITISNLRDYFDVRDLDDAFAPGTEVTLHLKPSKINYCRSLEYAGYLKTNIRFLDVPVTFEDQDGRCATLGRDALSYHDPKTAAIDFIAPLRFKHAQGYLLLRAQKNVDHIFSVDTAKGGVSVFQDGILVTQLDTLLPEGARQNVIGRINLLGQDKCALSMDRNRIFWTDGQLLEIKNAIRKGLADAASQFVAAVTAQNVEPKIQQSIVNNLSIFFDFNEVDDDVHQRLCAPLRKVVEKRFRDFVRIHFPHTRRNEGIPEADGYSQSWQKRIMDAFRK